MQNVQFWTTLPKFLLLSYIFPQQDISKHSWEKTDFYFSEHILIISLFSVMRNNWNAPKMRDSDKKSEKARWWRFSAFHACFWVWAILFFLFSCHLWTNKKPKADFEMENIHEFVLMRMKEYVSGDTYAVTSTVLEITENLFLVTLVS